MRHKLTRRSRLTGWALCVALTGAFLVNCVPVAAEHACECCTSDSLQVVRDFTVAKVVSMPSPSTFVVVHMLAPEAQTPRDGLFQYASQHPPRFTPPGVPLYLLATTFLI